MDSVETGGDDVDEARELAQIRKFFFHHMIAQLETWDGPVTTETWDQIAPFLTIWHYGDFTPHRARYEWLSSREGEHLIWLEVIRVGPSTWEVAVLRASNRPADPKVAEVVDGMITRVVVPGDEPGAWTVG